MSARLAVVLAGGSGTRLWPLSRQRHPKPFITLPDGETLIVKTLQRLRSLPDLAGLLIVANESHQALVSEALQQAELPLAAECLLEPQPRNTAAAVAAAVEYVATHFAAVEELLITPADHLIFDHAAFSDDIGRASSLAAQGRIVTLGIPATHPDPNFGYIEVGDELAPHAYTIARFIEKPDLATAQNLLIQGRVFWNAGLFCARVNTLRQELTALAPSLVSAVQQALHAAVPRANAWMLGPAYSEIPAQPFDRVIMERTRLGAVVRACFDWCDVGSWNALAQLLPADAAGNRTHGQVHLSESRGCTVIADSRLIVGLGLEDLIIVDTPDALLVARRDDVAKVGQLTESLAQVAPDAIREHRTVKRPWGSYTLLEINGRYRIKRLTIKPGASLSLQRHHHRSEHWVVISGTAKVVRNQEEYYLRPNESTFIPVAVEHRLINPGLIDCVLIEVQTGDWLSEDDIVRIEDHYGRHS